MSLKKFSRTVHFDMNAVSEICLFEYFFLLRCTILNAICQNEKCREDCSQEIAGILTLAVSRLDEQYGRASWSSTISEHADIFFENGRAKAALSWKRILNLFPPIFDLNFDYDILSRLAKARSIRHNESSIRLAFNEETGRQMDYPEAYALCRALLRQEIGSCLNGRPLELRYLIGMIATVLKDFEEMIGAEWIYEIETIFMLNSLGRATKEERIVGLFPVFQELGLTSQAKALFASKMNGE